MWTWISAHITTVKDVAQTLAFLSAFVYFVYKVLNGYLVVNTSMTTELIRTPTSATTDTVAIIATLERGQLGTLILHDLRARVMWGDNEEIVEFPDIRRLSFKTVQNPRRKEADFQRGSSSAPLLRLAPGEKVSFGVSREGASHLPCTVSTVALGRLACGWKIGQWRASRSVAPRSYAPAGESAEAL